MNDGAAAFAAVAIAYLAGSIPFAYLVIRWRRGIDVRNVGTRNVGTLNTYSQARWWALPVLAGDVGKGALAVGLVDWLGAPDNTVYGAAVAALAGHNWPVFLGFRGGKGAATACGIALALIPVFTAISLGGAVAIALVTRKAMPGIMAGTATLNILTVATLQPVGKIGLFLGLTFFIGVLYFWGQRNRIVQALRRGRWLQIFGID